MVEMMVEMMVVKKAAEMDHTKVVSMVYLKVAKMVAELEIQMVELMVP